MFLLFSDVGNQRIKRQSPEIIAFHATIDPMDDTGGNAANKAIVFPDVTINIGNAYHPSVGLFIAPTNGLYMFSISLLHGIHHSGEVTVNLMKNRNSIANSHSRFVSGAVGQGSTSVVVQLVVGDEIYIKLRDPDGAALRADKMSSFMGYLLTSL